jgi:hypothetical protein
LILAPDVGSDSQGGREPKSTRRNLALFLTVPTMTLLFSFLAEAVVEVLCSPPLMSPREKSYDLAHRIR